MNQSNGTSGFATQAEKIESLLRSRYGQWIPAYELSDLALQYCARIAAIRKNLARSGDRERIENKTEWVNGQCHGSYRIALAVDVLGIAPAKPQPVKSWQQVCAERDEKTRQLEPSFELVP
ncbi:MAG: hypothetical protein ACHQLQ_01850 [Candidatus Acidiferrales bacterium]